MRGATREEWEAFARLNCADLLPIPADRSLPVADGSGYSDGKFCKVPGRIKVMNHGRYSGNEAVVGLVNWTKNDLINVDDFIDDRRYNIGMQCRRVKAIDLDVDDRALLERIKAITYAELGVDLPMRTRPNSTSCAQFYRLDRTEPLAKNRIVLANQQMIEFMGDGQQMVVAGLHTSGVYYEWPDGIPETLDDIPLITFAELKTLYEALSDLRPVGVTATPGNWELRQIELEAKNEQQIADDPVVQYLEEHWTVYRYAPHKGGVFVQCPYEDDHTPPTAEDSALYMLPSEQYPHGGFDCRHANHGGRGKITLDMFLDAVGYRTLEIKGEFGEVAVQTDRAPRPAMTYTKNGQIKACEANYAALLGWPDGFGFDVRYDEFKGAQVYRDINDAKWHDFTDEAYTAFRLRAIERNMEDSIHMQKFKQHVDLQARKASVDTAQLWLTAQVWDGVPRIDNFHTQCWRVPDTPYHRAVAQYLWTALAGRTLEPGVKADMVPILSGPQGTRKSTFVECLAPSPNEYLAVTLDERDADLSRKLRGKMIVEWDELRGLHRAELESIKAWVTRRVEDWVPKYREFATTFLRRFVIVGTTNHQRFLSDPTGYRRWLPVFIRQDIDTDYLLEFREQLWAEAKEMFTRTGVRWQDAMHLARDQHEQAILRDIWFDAIRDWVLSKDDFSTMQVLNMACHISTSKAQGYHRDRVARVLTQLGYVEDASGKWQLEFA